MSVYIPMECNKLRPEYHLLEVFSAVIKILLYRNHSICLNEMCSRYLANLEVKGLVTINASLVTLPVSLFGHKIKLLLFTEYIVHMS